MPRLARHPIAPLQPEIDAALPFRSWVVVADADRLAAFNTQVRPDDGPPCEPWDEVEGRLLAHERYQISDDDALVLMLHPDERVPVAVVDLLSHYQAEMPGPVGRLVAFHALAARLQRGMERHATVPYTPLAEAFATLRRMTPRPDLPLPAPLAQRLARRVQLLPIRWSDATLATREAADRRAAFARLATPPDDAVFTSLTPLPELLYTLPREAFVGASPAIVDAFHQWSRMLTWKLTDAGIAAPALRQPGLSHLPAASLEALRRNMVAWVCEEIAEHRARPQHLSSSYPTEFLRQLYALGYPLAADHLRRIFVDLPLNVLDADYAPNGPIARHVRRPRYILPGLNHLLSSLQPAVGDGDEAELEKLIVVSRDNEALGSLLRRIPLTPRLGRAALYASAVPGVRAVVAEHPTLRHEPLIERMLVASAAEEVVAPYLRGAPPERFAHYFCAVARRAPVVALTIAADRWDEVNDYMDPADFTVIPAAKAELPPVAALVEVLTRDLALRDRGVTPGPLVLPPQDDANPNRVRPLGR